MSSLKKFRSNFVSIDEEKTVHLQESNNLDVNICDLDDYSLGHIFTFLPIAEKIKIERVCKRWNEVSLSSWSQFKKLDLTKDTWGLMPHGTKHKIEDISLETIESVLKRCGFFLHSINFSAYKDHIFYDSFDCLILISQYCPNITSVNVANGGKDKVTRIGIQELAKSCKAIENLKLYFNCYYREENYFNEFSSLFLNNKNIKSILFNGFIDVNNSFVNLNYDSLIELSLNISTFPILVDDIKFILKKAKNLKVLKCNVATNILGIIRALSDSDMSNLEELSFGDQYNRNLNDDYEEKLIRLFKKCYNLKCLKLNDLNITGKCLLSLNSKIKNIHLYDCDWDFDKNFMNICLNNLLELDSFSINEMPRCSSNNPVSLEITKPCLNLKNLNIKTSNLSISVNTIILFQNLRTLCLTSNSSVNDDFLKILSVYLMKLKLLNVAYCKFTDIGLSAISNLQDLEFLSIAMAPVTGEGFGNLPNIIKLDCNGCRNIENHNLLKLIKSASNLEYLNLQNCIKITNEFIDQVIKITKRRENHNFLTTGIKGTRININNIKEKSNYLRLIDGNFKLFNKNIF